MKKKLTTLILIFTLGIVGLAQNTLAYNCNDYTVNSKTKVSKKTGKLKTIRVSEHYRSPKK
jgi:hypothetical protein